MKKFLLTVALILAVVTSLTAGTLASYTKTIDSFGDVYSKKFDFNTTKSESMKGQLKLVPGDKVVYKIEVAQDMEVPVTYTVTSTLSGSDNLLSRLTKTVKLVDGSGNVVKSGDSFTVSKAAGKVGFSFLVEVAWDKTSDNAADIAASGQSVTLKVGVNGTSTEARQDYEETQNSGSDI